MEKDKIQAKMISVETSVSYIEDIIYDVVYQYSHDLDVIMREINDNILKDDYPAINLVEQYFLRLSSALYFMCEKVEKLGVYDSIGKLNAQETYNAKYLEASNPTSGKKPSVGELQAISDNASVYDKAVSDMYTRAYKILKNKVSAAETMTSTLSKILSHRMQESQMTTNQVERRILNEGNAF